MDEPELPQKEISAAPEPEKNPDAHCPVCSATLLQEKCKVVCRSPRCTYRIIFNCAEF